MATRGVVYIHATPTALCPHIEWAVGGVLGARVAFEWTGQPAAPGTVRAELSWQGEPGAAASIASALRDWRLIRFEVTEEPSAGGEGERYSWTPDLGLFSATIGMHGDILVREDRLRSAVARASSDPAVTVEEEIAGLLGAPWDEELEPFRYAGEGAPVRWLHQVV